MNATATTVGPLSMKFGDNGPTPEESGRILTALDNLARSSRGGIIIKYKQSPESPGMRARAFRLAQYTERVVSTVPGKAPKIVYYINFRMFEPLEYEGEADDERRSYCPLMDEASLRSFELDPERRTITYSCVNRPSTVHRGEPPEHEIIEVEHFYEFAGS